MIDALHYEWARIRSIRSTYWIIAVAMLIGIGLSFLISMGSSIAYRNEAPSSVELDFLAPAIVTQFAAVAGPYLIAYVLVIIGVLAWGHEYRFGLIRTTLTAHNSRCDLGGQIRRRRGLGARSDGGCAGGFHVGGLGLAGR